MKIKDLDRVNDLKSRLGYLSQQHGRVLDTETARIGDVTFTTKDIEHWNGVQISQGTMCQFRANAREAIQRNIDAVIAEIRSLGVEIDA